MRLNINNISVWYAHQSQPNVVTRSEFTELPVERAMLPQLDWVPAMQRRRLSPFAKISLYCAQQSAANSCSSIVGVFSSRHGDLHKTQALLGDVAVADDLSPMAFGLSVHNAVSGLYSILNKNTQAMSAVSAGKDTLVMAIVDAYAKLKSGQCEQVLLVHSDQALPDVYDEFRDEFQTDHAIAAILSLPESSNGAQQKPLTVSISRNDKSTNNESTSWPMALCLAEFLQSGEIQLELTGQNSDWVFTKDVA